MVYQGTAYKTDETNSKGNARKPIQWRSKRRWDCLLIAVQLAKAGYSVTVTKGVRQHEYGKPETVLSVTPSMVARP